jgi:hypothetical protein
MTTFKTSLTIAVIAGASALGTGVASAATSSVPLPGHTSATHQALAFKKIAFKATFKGTLALLWADSSVSATSVSGTGTATLLGKATLKGTGSAPFDGQSQCEPLSGKGVLSGGGSKLNISVAAATMQAGQACGAGQSTPTSVTVSKGVAKVTGGTGKYKGVSGTLTYKATFSIQSTTSGTSESDSFTATLTGTLRVRK